MGIHHQSRDEDIVAWGRDAIAQNRQVWHHASSEFERDLGLIMTTVIDEGPLVYAVPANAEGDGQLVCANDYPGVIEHYQQTYALMHVTGWRPSIELRTPWYTLFDGISTYRLMENGEPGALQSVVFFPMNDEPGILGEMPWSRVLANEVPADAIEGIAPDVARRDATRAFFLEYLAALRAGDATAAAGCYGPVADMVCRPYPSAGRVGATKWSRENIRDYFDTLFGAYEIEAVDIVSLLAMEWYAFAELQWRVRDRESGELQAFHTADVHGASRTDSFSCRLGWGTQAVPQAV